MEFIERRRHHRGLHATRRLLVGRLAVTAVTVALATAAPTNTRADAMIRISNVGQGDGIIIYCPFGDSAGPDGFPSAAQLQGARKLVVDYGSTTYPEPAIIVPRSITGDVIAAPPGWSGFTAEQRIRDNLVRALERGGANPSRADQVVITHGDRDHYNILSTSISSGDFSVSEAFIGGYPSAPIFDDMMNPGDFTKSQGRTLMEVLRNRVLTQAGFRLRWPHVEVVRQGGNIQLNPASALPTPASFYADEDWDDTVSCNSPATGESLRFRVMAANMGFTEGQSGPDINRRSVVLLARYTSASGAVEDVWLTGDATERTEKAIRQHYTYRADVTNETASTLRRPNSVILKIAHHGDPKASSGRFLTWLRPTQAYVSGLPTSSHGHPRCELLPRFTILSAVDPVEPKSCATPEYLQSLRKRRRDGTPPPPPELPSRVQATFNNNELFIYLGGAQ